MISSDEVIRIFEERGALLRGHFLLASGKHSDAFLQAARVIQYPEELVRLCGALADTFRDQNVDLVVGPAFHVLATIEVGSYQPADCPMCKSSVPLVDPDDLFA